MKNNIKIFYHVLLENHWYSIVKEQLNKIQQLDSQVIELSDLLHMPTEKTNLQLLDDIEVIRTDNNKNWMDVVRLCFELDEERAQAIFYKIKELNLKTKSFLQMQD